MIRQSWSIRIEAPKPPPPPPKSTASRVAHWAGLPHYRLPRFNLADEAMLQELQTDELDEEDYALLPTSSLTAGSKARHEVQLVNVPDRKGFSDRAPKPKRPGGKLQKFKASFKSKSKQTPRMDEESEEEEIAVGHTVPPDFDSNSADYPRHPRTPDRYMLPLSRGSSGRERRNSMTSVGDRTEGRIFGDVVKAPVALRKSPPQFLQNWDDDSPYIYNYTNRTHDTDYLYPPRSRPMNRTMSIASSSRLPILHESRHEISTDDYGISRGYTIPLTQQSLPDPQFWQRKGNQSQIPASPQGSPQKRESSAPSVATSQQTSDEAALTEISTEIQIGGERMGKRSHTQPMHTIEEWVQKIGTPPELSGTPKTVPSNEVEVEELLPPKRNTYIDEVFQASPMHEEIEDSEVPIPVPTEASPDLTPVAPQVSPDEVEKRLSGYSSSPEIEHIEVISPNYKWPTVEDLMAATSPVKRGATETQTSTPITVVRIPPAEGAQMPLPPIKAPLPSRLSPEGPLSRMPSPLEDASPLPVVAPLRFPPRTPTLPSGLEEKGSSFSGQPELFQLDPRAAEKRRMTVAFGITPLQRRETAELAQDVLRRVSTTAISGEGRRGSLASVIRVVDVLLVNEREEQLRMMRRAEMAWD
ncbi:hypothetical protein TWF173_011142 [Orbilia oligospora]|nr:hypothetical protein TWF173_011142 [Orbilia oligospora]